MMPIMARQVRLLLTPPPPPILFYVSKAKKKRGMLLVSKKNILDSPNLPAVKRTVYFNYIQNNN